MKIARAYSLLDEHLFASGTVADQCDGHIYLFLYEMYVVLRVAWQLLKALALGDVLLPARQLHIHGLALSELVDSRRHGALEFPAVKLVMRGH